jgi:hypothetical protein
MLLFALTRAIEIIVTAHSCPKGVSGISRVAGRLRG